MKKNGDPKFESRRGQCRGKTRIGRDQTVPTAIAGIDSGCQEIDDDIRSNFTNDLRSEGAIERIAEFVRQVRP